jgi:elongation factor 1-beta
LYLWLTSFDRLLSIFVSSYAPSQADVVVFQAIASSPDVKKYPQAARWWAHIKSWESEHASLAGEKKELSSYGPAKGSTSARKSLSPSQSQILLPRQY